MVGTDHTDDPRRGVGGRGVWYSYYTLSQQQFWSQVIRGSEDSAFRSRLTRLPQHTFRRAKRGLRGAGHRTTGRRERRGITGAARSGVRRASLAASRG
jgi:hypothetical protein